MDNISYGKLDNHPKDAVLFFKVMMRLEYALKACGFAEMRNNRLEIKWDEFANDRLGKTFFEQVHNSGIANTLIEKPPSRQIRTADGMLDFDPVAKCGCIQDLIGGIRRVRNNLFHGGKSGDVDHDRNDALIAEAIAVIGKILNSNDDLRTEFEGP